MPRLGQHFLKDKRILRLIVRALDLQPGETAIEIGAGHGELTAALYETAAKREEGKTRSFAIRIIAIERDVRLVDVLKKKFFDENNVNVVHGDVLKILPSLFNTHPSFFAPRSSLASYKLAGNLPYYLTGRLLRIVGELEPKPRRCVFILQKEVAERICAVPSRMTRLAASVQFWATPSLIAEVPQTAFRPMPKVKSTVIRLEKREERSGISENDYYKAVRILFRQPRKTVVNNVLGADRHGLSGNRSRLTRKVIEDRLRRLGFDERARPQDLNVEQIITLSEIL